MAVYHAVFQQHERYWLGYLEELPGAMVQGHSLEETRQKLRESALRLIENHRENVENEVAGHSVIRELMDIELEGPPEDVDFDLDEES